ncbi:MAG: tetratricopeptide repeat protein [Verrucomicrobiales bacterium]|nr:tetratricopeptide repeat protein [Verrucomicrobiales bacterium]
MLDPHNSPLQKAIEEASRILETTRRRAHLDSSQYRGDLIHALTVLAALRLKQEDFTKSDRLYREAEMHADEEWKHVAPEIRVKLKSQRGYLRECRGDTEGAILCYEAGLEIAEEHNITLSEIRAVIHNNLAILFKRAEKWEQSEHHYKMALVILEALVGANSDKVAAIYNNIGTFYTRRDKLKSAYRMFRRALGIRERFFKDDSHPDVQQSLKNLGAASRALGLEQEAQTCFDRVPEKDVILFLQEVFGNEETEQETMESFSEVA